MAISIFPRQIRNESQRILKKDHWSNRGLRLLYAGFPENNGLRLSGISPDGLFPNPNGIPAACPGGVKFATNAYYFMQDILYPLPALNKLTTQATILYIARKTDSTNRGAQIGVGTIATNPEKFVIQCPFSDGTVYWDFGGQSAPNRVSAAGLTTQGIITWAFVAGTRGNAIYRNGKSEASGSTAITRTGSGFFYINHNPFNVSGDNIDLHLLAVLDAEWTPSMVAEWSVNPWGTMFENNNSYGVLGGSSPFIGLRNQLIRTM